MSRRDIACTAFQPPSLLALTLSSSGGIAGGSSSGVHTAWSEATYLFGSVLGRSHGDASQHVLWMALLCYVADAATARPAGQRQADFSGDDSRHMALHHNRGIWICAIRHCHPCSRGGRAFAQAVVQWSWYEACWGTARGRRGVRCGVSHG